jgi:Na+-translocating ferredoxin:NAD+ oxidoreductase RnfG subunit
VTKSGASAEDEIDAISSATITSRAFTNAENGAKAFLLECLKGGEE